MSYDEDEDVSGGFKMGGDEDEFGELDEPLEIPDEVPEDLELEDPDDKYH